MATFDVRVTMYGEGDVDAELYLRELDEYVDDMQSFDPSEEAPVDSMGTLVLYNDNDDIIGTIEGIAVREDSALVLVISGSPWSKRVALYHLNGDGTLDIIMADAEEAEDTLELSGPVKRVILMPIPRVDLAAREVTSQWASDGTIIKYRVALNNLTDNKTLLGVRAPLRLTARTKLMLLMSAALTEAQEQW